MTKRKKASKRVSVESSQSDQAIERAQLRTTIEDQEKRLVAQEERIVELRHRMAEAEGDGVSAMTPEKEAHDAILRLHPMGIGSYPSVSTLRGVLPLALCGMFGMKPGLCDRRFLKAAIELIEPDFPNLRRSAMRSVIEGSVDGIIKPLTIVPSWAKKRLEQGLTVLDVIETVLHRAGQEGATNGRHQTET